MEGFMEGFPSHFDSLPAFPTPYSSPFLVLYTWLFACPLSPSNRPLPRAVALPSHTTPDEDTENPSLTVTGVTVDGDWTSVTFYRYSDELDDDEVSPRPAKVTSSDSQKNLDTQQWLCSPVTLVILCHTYVYMCLVFSLCNPLPPINLLVRRQDYDIYDDLDGETKTHVIFSYRDGAGVGQHANSNRGASTVDFLRGTSITVRRIKRFHHGGFYTLHTQRSSLSRLLFLSYTVSTHLL